MPQPLPDQSKIPITASEEINPEDIFNTISWEKVLEEDEEDEHED